jgi:hypothetical protein
MPEEGVVGKALYESEGWARFPKWEFEFREEQLTTEDRAVS